MLDALNQLLQLHYRSLPMYLRHAEPWAREGSDERIAAVRDILADHERIASICADWIQRRGGLIELGEFSMEFTDLHDLSLDFLLRELIVYQRQLIEEIKSLLPALSTDPPVHSLAQEALGAARGHLQNLEEIQRKKAAA